MEQNSNEKKVKVSRHLGTLGYSNLRVKKDIKKRILSDLAKINKKDLGRKVHVSEYLIVLMGLFTEDHIHALQEASLSNADRLEREYRKYLLDHEFLSKDDYLGGRLRGEIQ